MYSGMRRIVAAVCLVALMGTGLAQGQLAANDAVQGSISSVSAAKDSFRVTAKKADLNVKVNADTRYVLDDMPSDAAKALLTGYDVNAIIGADGNAFVVIVSSVALKGTVKEVAADKASFVVTSKKGVDTTVKLTAATKYTMGKKDGAMDQVLTTGNTVTVDLGPDGTAADVVGKAAKAGTTPPATVQPGGAETPTTPPVHVVPAN
jgi:hypothetical protein